MNFGGSDKLLLSQLSYSAIYLFHRWTNISVIFHTLLFAFCSFIYYGSKVVFIFPIGTIIIFWSQIFTGDVTENIIKMGSLLLITPLAYFFGVQFAKNQKQDDVVIQTKERAVGAADEISKDVDEAIKSEQYATQPSNRT